MIREKSYAVKLIEKLQSIVGKPKQGSQVRQRISEGKKEILKDLYYGFAEALIWAEFDLNRSEEDDDSYNKTFEEEGYTIHEISQDSKDQIWSACVAFYTAVVNDGLLPDSSDIDWVQIGRCFYLAGQGHGISFLDYVGTNDAFYDEETARKLNDLAEKFGMVRESWSENDEVCVDIQ